MSYVTIIKNPKGKEISLDQILSCDVDTSKPRKKRAYPGTVTRVYPSDQRTLYSEEDIKIIIKKLTAFNEKWNTKFYTKYSDLYQTFNIPKRSGGLREINAPKETLSNAQTELRKIFFNDFHAAYHTTAYAYAKGRNTLKCVKRHQANKNKWFLKLDFSNFFGNTNEEFVLSQLKLIAPFDLVMANEEGLKELKAAIRICFLNDGLPQGTRISPMLTNLIMIPVDHEINKALHKRGFTYTRYADDIQISHKQKFSYNKVIAIVRDILKQFNAPYTIKQEKTRFGSSSGRNFNLGLMLNKDNQITIGHEKHKLMKAKINSFILDTEHGKSWPKKDIERLAGQIAYWKSIEPKTAEYTIEHFNKKYKVNVEHMMKDHIKNNDIYQFFVKHLSKTA